MLCHIQVFLSTVPRLFLPFSKNIHILFAPSQCTHCAGVAKLRLRRHCFPCRRCFPTAFPTDRAFYQLPAIVFWNWYITFHGETNYSSIPYFVRCDFNSSFHVFSPSRYQMYNLDSIRTYPDCSGRHFGTFSCIHSLHSNTYLDIDRSKKFYIPCSSSFPPSIFHAPFSCLRSTLLSCKYLLWMFLKHPTSK